VYKAAIKVEVPQLVSYCMLRHNFAINLCKTGIIVHRNSRIN